MRKKISTRKISELKEKRSESVNVKTASKNIPLLNETHTQIKLQMRNATERMLKNRIKKLRETYREIEREKLKTIWMNLNMTGCVYDMWNGMLAFVLMQRISFACSDLMILPPQLDYKSLASV